MITTRTLAAPLSLATLLALALAALLFLLSPSPAGAATVAFSANRFANFDEPSGPESSSVHPNTNDLCSLYGTLSADYNATKKRVDVSGGFNIDISDPGTCPIIFDSAHFGHGSFDGTYDWTASGFNIPSPYQSSSCSGWCETSGDDSLPAPAPGSHTLNVSMGFSSYPGVSHYRSRDRLAGTFTIVVPPATTPMLKLFFQ